jgi:glycosyltransferase involved in cell wall biosynthesis
MKVLICTVFDIDIPCAGLNRLTKMSKALESYGIQCLISVGSGSFGMEGQAWKYWEEQGQKYILFDKSLFTARRHCNAMRIAATAAKFYKKYLSEVAQNLRIAGIIVYSPQSQLIAPLFSICKINKIFIIADCIENHSLSFKHLLNGVIYQQMKFRIFQMKNLDGAIIQSQRWLIDTKNANIPESLIPGFLDPQDCFRSSPSIKSDKFKITIMGRFLGREMPSVIINALKICKQNKLSFEVNIVGSSKGGWIESYWLKKLTGNSNICNDINIRGYVSNRERDNILTESDIFIMLRPPSKETQYVYPSRVSEFLYSGNPVILTDTPALNEFFQQELGVYFISSKNDSTELAQLIMDLADKPLERFESGKKGRIYAMNNFSLKVMGKKLSDFINVINNKY